jgi:plasmid rolling circle replication initiator protein Rep
LKSITNDCENRKQKLTSARPEDFLSSARLSDRSLKTLKGNENAGEKARLSFSLDTVLQSPILDNNLADDFVAKSDLLDVDADVLTKYVARQLKRAAKLEGRLEHKKEIVKLLHKFGFVEQADKLKKCNANVSVLVCDSGHSFRKVVDYRCHLPICADCCESKSLARLGTTLPKFLQAIKDNPDLILAFLTLTLRSDKKRSLKGGCKQLKAYFSRLRGRKVWKKHCIGGYNRIENTFNRMLGWHPHLHALILLESYIPQAELSDNWHAITKDSKIVDIREVRDLVKGLVECIKYPFKLSDVRSYSRAQFKEIFALKGERLGVSFGDLYGMKLDADIDETLDNDYVEFIEETKNLAIGDACPICQSRLDLVDFSAHSYAKFLLSVPIESHTRGKPH